MEAPLDLLLLGAVARGPAHGYALIERIRDTSGGELSFAEGTIYPALHRLEAAGMLKSSWDEAAGRRRRVYVLTARGRKELARERADWKLLDRVVKLVAG